MAPTEKALFEIDRGTGPLLVNVPHCGQHIPGILRATMTPEADKLTDTDWHIDRLYIFASEMNITFLRATHSRYVVDLNRPPDGAKLYPGQTETGLCPETTFAGAPLYKEALSDADIEERRETYWQPYHQTLRAELDRIKKTHGYVILWDAHSIAARVPSLFEGRLPDFNFGTNGGVSCDAKLSDAITHVLNAQSNYSHVLNGRFKGGYITRHYGDPGQGVHAIQLELVQQTYMDGAPTFAWREDLADKVRPLIKECLEELLKVSL